MFDLLFLIMPNTHKEEIEMDSLVNRRPLFNENGDTEISKKRMINGNTTNLNDFNNMKYSWVSDWYRQAMNNFWIPEEINLAQDLKDYKSLWMKKGRLMIRFYLS